MGWNEFFNQKNGSLPFLATCGGLIHQTTNDHQVFFLKKKTRVDDWSFVPLKNKKIKPGPSMVAELEGPRA